MLGPFLEVEMSKKCGPLWREAHLEVKMHKGPLLEVDMSKKCTPLRREAHVEVKMHKNTPGSDHFWAFRLAGTVQEACSSEMLGGQGADFLRGFAF